MLIYICVSDVHNHFILKSAMPSIYIKHNNNNITTNRKLYRFFKVDIWQ